MFFFCCADGAFLLPGLLRLVPRVPEVQSRAQDLGEASQPVQQQQRAPAISRTSGCRVDFRQPSEVLVRLEPAALNLKLDSGSRVKHFEPPETLVLVIFCV